MLGTIRRGIVKMLKAKGRLIDEGALKHPYPHCWRSETPLIYKVCM